MDIHDLQQLADNKKMRSIVELFSDIKRTDKYALSAANLYLDYSKQNINDDELNTLFLWAKQQKLSEKIAALFSGSPIDGDNINNTENRQVLHSVLRAPEEIKRQVLADDFTDVINTEKKMAAIVNDINNGLLVSASQQKYTDVLAIGIGGSFYGIKVALSALKSYQNTGLNVHVLANVDGGAVQEKLQLLSAETTLVVVISKTFTTQETLLNALAVKEWMLAASSHDDIIKKQWYAVSTNIVNATEFGIDENHILPMWDWVGGRFSLWSAVGLPLALAIGNDNYARLKVGAYQMDEHFKKASLAQNMPVVMALVGIWNRNGLQCPSLAILPYDHALRALPGYLQQTDMESNGKSVSNKGEKLQWQTAPIVFGQEGTNGQHAFMQLMHQSEDIIPTDFIVALQGVSKYHKNHKVLVANCFAQSEALMQGKTLQQAKNELITQGKSPQQVAQLAPHKTMKGNTPSNTLLMDQLSPETLGALLALYEHKIFVQGMMWQVNSFDQWGVELGKELGQQVMNVIDGHENGRLSSSTLSPELSPELSPSLSSSTLSLIKKFKSETIGI
ncbi:MAG: glucose-6-phosphate isomerase [Alteromonadaceae bacterium]|jgi:glucose-6-phosphate isomerase